MTKTLEKILDKLTNADKSFLFNKKVLYPLAIILLLHIFHVPIEGAIYKYFLIDIIPNGWFDLIFIFISFLIILFSISKLFISYKPSLFYYLSIGGAIYCFWMYRFNDTPWFYYEMRFVKYGYLDSIITSIMIYPIVSLYQKIVDYFFTLNSLKIEDGSNIFIEDVPIVASDKDVLKNGFVISNLSESILNDNYEKSFTIGLVGPWGNGKSSLISLLKEELSIKNSEALEINFYPYLNHSEEDIISDFFTSFGSAIKRFDGTIHKQVSSYSEALLKLYKNKNLKSIADLKVDLDKSGPVYELYNKINDSLISLNKKLIVYVDDLDRLNAGEILEILKLIRNTANFRNTTFIVAMDKDYIVKTIKGENTNKHHKFIDKFFQLEVYIPEIEKSILVQEFFKLLNNPNIDKNITSKISNSFANRRLLFNRYINNLRDVKRFANQIIFETRFGVFSEIDTVDFLNFILLKMRFPRFIQILTERKESFLTLRNGYFNLKFNESEGDDLNTLNAIQMFQNDLTENVQYSDYDISKYLISDKNDCLSSELGIDCEESELLIYSLIFLFGRKNSENTSSIKYERNFHRLMRGKYAKDDFKESEFNLLLKQPENLLDRFVKTLINGHKADQLITRINFHSIKSKKELKLICIVLFYLWAEADIHRLNKPEIIRLLSTYLNDNSDSILVNKEYRLNPADKEKLVNSYFFTTQNVSFREKIFLLVLLKESEEHSGLWGFDIEKINTKGLELFRLYFEELEECWKVNDFTVYQHYNELKKVSNLQELNTVFKDYLNQNGLSVFCAQMIDVEPFHILSFKVSEFIPGMFGYFDAFKEFIDLHMDANTPELLEFQRFYKIMHITNYNDYVKFIFKSLELRDYSGLGKVSDFDTSEDSLRVELFIKFDKVLLNFHPKVHNINFSASFKFYDIEECKYLSINTTKVNSSRCLIEVFKTIHKELLVYPDVLTSTPTVSPELRQGIIKDENGNVIIELISMEYGN